MATFYSCTGNNCSLAIHWPCDTNSMLYMPMTQDLWHPAHAQRTKANYAECSCSHTCRHSVIVWLTFKAASHVLHWCGPLLHILHGPWCVCVWHGCVVCHCMRHMANMAELSWCCSDADLHHLHYLLTGAASGGSTPGFQKQNLWV